MNELAPAILLIEDNPTARKLFRITLEAEGYRVLEAIDGRSALALLRLERPAVVLQDLVLPDHDGFELAKEIRALPGCSDLPIVVMSAFPRLLDRVREKGDFFNASLMKPVPPSVLVDFVRRYLPAPTTASDAFGTGKSLLIVDDNPVQLKLARLRFADLGFEVRTAIDATTALALARQSPPDAVLCDVLMAGVDGYEMCIELRKTPELAAVPVVLISAHYGGKHDEELAHAAGASALVLRSATFDEGIEAVRASLTLVGLPTSSDAESFGKHHAVRVIAQLERQALTYAGIAERSAFQSAQLSVLAGMTDAITRSKDIDAALADVLAASLDAGGITRGALFRTDAGENLKLSIAMGFPESSQIDQLFGFRSIFDSGEPGSIVTPHMALSAADTALFLERMGAKVAVTIPVMDGFDRVGALLLGTDRPGVSEHDLATFGRAIAAHVAQALALNESFTRLKATAEASRVLSASLDVVATLKVLGGLATGELAELCEIRIRADAPVVYAGRRLPPPVIVALAELRNRYPDHPIISTDGTASPGRASIITPAVSDVLLAPLASEPAHLELLRALTLGSHLVVPLVAGAHHLGTIAFARLADSRPFREVDILAAEDLAQRAASALDNARLHEATLAANLAKDEFLATVSHELRSPLNAVLGWAQMLRDGLPDALREKALSAIERNALAQAALIDDLLDMSRIVSGAMRLDTAPVQLGPIVARALESLKPQMDAKGLVLQAPLLLQSTAVLVGDASRLQQIVSNLLSNALKFTPAGGLIVVELTHVADQISLIICDDGKGIAPKFLPYVFERFKQADGSTSRAHAGLGLGLAIVRHLVELHGGTITASSPGLGLGASFAVLLPACVAIAGSAPAHKGRSNSHDRVGKLGGVTVLVVDDEPDTREMMVALLQDLGASASSACSSLEALAMIAKARPHIVLSDLGMPGEDGYSLIRTLRLLPTDQGGSIPAVAVSGFATGDDRKRALDAGFQKHLSKPIKVDDLLETVAHLSREHLHAK